MNSLGYSVLIVQIFMNLKFGFKNIDLKKKTTHYW